MAEKVKQNVLNEEILSYNTIDDVERN